MKIPNKDAKVDVVFKYALKLYGGDRKKAEGYCRGWFQAKSGSKT